MSVSFVQGSGSSSTYEYANGTFGAVLPAYPVLGDAVVLVSVNLVNSTAPTGISASFGSLMAPSAPQTGKLLLARRRRLPRLQRGNRVHHWRRLVWAAFEFGPNAGQGAASAGYANFNNTSANSIFGDPGTVASATIENVTTGAAYVVVVFDRSGGSIESVPGSPWTGLQNFLGVTGTGVAWLVAPNANPIPISFDVIDNESWTLAFVEILAAPCPDRHRRLAL